LGVLGRELSQNGKVVVFGLDEQSTMREAAELAAQVANGCGGMIDLAESGEIDIRETLGANHLAMFTVEIHVALPVIEQIKKPFPFLDDHFPGNGKLGGLVGRPKKRSGKRPQYAGAYPIRSKAQAALKPSA
jgi:hypothetical protein